MFFWVVVVVVLSCVCVKVVDLMGKRWNDGTVLNLDWNFECGLYFVDRLGERVGGFMVVMPNLSWIGSNFVSG